MSESHVGQIMRIFNSKYRVQLGRKIFLCSYRIYIITVNEPRYKPALSVRAHNVWGIRAVRAGVGTILNTYSQRWLSKTNSLFQGHIKEIMLMDTQHQRSFPRLNHS